MRSALNLVNLLKIVAILIVASFVTGCSATFENHGYVPPDGDLADVIVGVDTRDTVADTIGRPTAAGVLTDSSWFYVQSRWRKFAYKAPEIIDRQLVAIRFTPAGVVENVERFTLEDGRVVPLSRRITDSNIKGVSFLRQLLGNLGNFNASKALAKN